MAVTKNSCKHLCCHEGTDKPPKPPKKATLTAPLREDLGSKPQSKSAPKQSAVPIGLQTSKANGPKIRKEVETVNLAHTEKTNEYAKVAPRAYRSLHQLHEKTNSSSKPSIASNTKPTFSYKRGEQPTFTFLSQKSDSKKGDEQPSSDYESGWMDDLPSPSALIQACNGAEEPVESIAEEREELLPDVGVLSAQNDEAGIGDFVENQQTMLCSGMGSGDNEYEEAMANLGSEDLLEVSQYFTKRRADRTLDEPSHSKLFMSTDSPEKPATPVKRKPSHSPPCEPGDCPSVSKAKKTKVYTTTDPHILQPSSSKENEVSTPVTTVEPGHSDWVYEFDPAFIAEWEPYVVFV